MYYTERSKKSSLFCETPLVQSSSSVNLSSAVDLLSQYLFVCGSVESDLGS